MPSPRRFFRFPFRTRRDIDADVRDEISFHLEMRVRELVERGWPEPDARLEARRQFGDLSRTAEYCARLDVDKETGMRMRRWLGELLQDVSYAIRMLSRQAGPASVAVLTLALGVGATTLVFSLVHASLLAPLPYQHADRLMVVRLSLPEYTEVSNTLGAFEDSGVYASNLYTIDDEQVLGGVASPGLFRTLGVSAQLGRTVADSDTAVPVVVIGHGLWLRRFGGDPHILGRTIQLSGTGFTVIGVMPATFQFPSRAFQVWTSLPVAMALAPEQATNRSLRIFQAVGRLQSGLTKDQAQAELGAFSRLLEQTYPDSNTGVTHTLVSLRDRMLGDVRTALWVALGCVVCLLFIACANVAGLTLARMTARVHELAVRAALGAGRWRIARQLVTESLVTTVCGGVVGVLLAYWGISAIPHALGDRVPRADHVTLNLPVLAVSFLTMIVGGVLVAVVPVLHIVTTPIEPRLRGSGRSAGEPRSGARLRSALVVAQIALAVVITSGALVLTRSFVKLLNVDAGFAPDRLLAFHLLLVDHPSPAARIDLANRVLASIASVPGVVSTGGATGLAPVTAQRSTTYEIDGRADVEASERRGYFVAASPAYFRTLGTPVIAGREFTEHDHASGQPVAIVSATLARRFFPDGHAVGRRLRLINPEFSNEWRTVVGVVKDVQYQGLDDRNQSVVYTPFAQTPFRWIYVNVRTEADPLTALGNIKSAVKSVDARLTVANPQPVTSLIADSAADPRFRSMLISLFASAALLLAAIGIHGVVAFSVARRAREIAIRLALGASVASVRWQIVGQALLLASAGIVLGLSGAMVLGDALTGLLYETTPADPLAMGGVAALLLAVTLAACALPARRATRIQPVEALRDA